jgi:predicted anti-sigma-YlaC factor YlaD
MKCEDMQELLALYADGSLGRKEVMGVKEHLAACASCSGELAALQDTLLLVREELTPPIPPELHQHIMQGISREKKRKNAKGNLSWWRLSRPLATAAAVLLIFFASGNLYLANQYHGTMPQYDMLAEGLPESDDAAILDERSKANEIDSSDSEEAPVASPPGNVKNFAYFNGSLILLGGGIWYYFRRFSREER